MILHILNRAPTSGTAASQALMAMGEEDRLLLIEDAVQAVLFSDWEGWQLLEGRIHVLEEDIRARGLESFFNHDANCCIDVDAFVDLTELATQSVSWF